MNKITERTIKQINNERRKFLEMIGKAGVSTSVLQVSSLAGAMMASRFAEAQTGGSKKFILLFHPNGAPRGYTGSIALNPFRPFGSTVAGLTMTIGKPGNHGNLQFASGANSYNATDATSSSIDQQVAKVLGNSTPFKSIQLGVQTGTQEGINRLNGANIARTDNPSTAFSRIFSGVTGSTGGSSSSAASGPTATEKKLSMLDANKKGLDALRNKLGSEERYRLDTHLDTLTSLENRLKSTPVTGGGSTGGGSTGGSCSKPGNIAASKSALTEYRMQGDIAVAALACGLTNVASIQFNETQATWLPGDGTADAVNFASDHHQANHGGQGVSLLPAICEYMNKGIANIIDKLQKAGIYNDTVILCVSEMGDGINHTPDAGPIIAASGISGFKGGNRNAGSDHYNIFPDVFKLLGIQSSVDGKILAKYPGGGVVA